MYFDLFNEKISYNAFYNFKIERLLVLCSAGHEGMLGGRGFPTIPNNYTYQKIKQTSYDSIVKTQHDNVSRS